MYIFIIYLSVCKLIVYFGGPLLYKNYNKTFHNMQYSKRVTQKKLPFSGVAAYQGVYALWRDERMPQF